MSENIRQIEDLLESLPDTSMGLIEGLSVPAERGFEGNDEYPNIDIWNRKSIEEAEEKAARQIKEGEVKYIPVPEKETKKVTAQISILGEDELVDRYVEQLEQYKLLLAILFPHVEAKWTI